jgi:hypothetical protein
VYGYLKTEAQMVNWVRSTLRKAWLKHPSRLGILQHNQKLLPSNKSNRLVIHHPCGHCKKWFRPDDVEVNHKVTVGACTWDNLGSHAVNLFNVKEADLEILCKTCHGIVTYSERSGMDMEDAAVEKKVIEFTKHSAAVQKEKLTKVGIVPGKTGLERRDQARIFLAAHMKKKKT